MLSKKGISMVFLGELSVLICIALVITVIILSFSSYLDINTIVEESTVERHALNLGQILLSSKRLAYYDGTFLRRGVFEVDKIDKEFVDGSDITREVGYPDSIMVIGIKDFENSRKWAIKFEGLESGGEGVSTVLGCVFNQIDDAYKIFDRGSIWNRISADECDEKNIYNYGTATRIFPVAIKYGDEVHLGGLFISIFEAWKYSEALEGMVAKE